MHEVEIVPAEEKPKFKLSDLVPEVAREIVYPPFEELTMLIYGPQGTGKTSFFGKSNAVMIIATEPGTAFQTARSRAVYRMSPDPDALDKRLDFSTMVSSIIEAHKEGKLQRIGVKLIVIDTIDALFEMAKAKGLAAWNKKKPKERYEHADEIPFGQGNSWGLKELIPELRRLQSVMPIAFISHEKIETVSLEDASGVSTEIEKRLPSVHWRCAEWLSGVQNIVGYAYKSVGGQFMIKFHSDARLETKDRTGLLEAHGRSIITSWDKVTGIYNAQAQLKGAQITSRFK